MNNLSKVNEEVVATWASILQGVPNSRLLMKNFSLGDPVVRRRYLERFEKYGIEAERVLLRPPISSYSEHLAAYNEIDIGLDTFPYNGTTTTCEALWMGVPVITVTGDLHAGRVGNSILSRMGLSQLVAGNRKQYEQIALELANDIERLRTLRQNLRGQMARSPLCNGAAFTRTLEAAYREMWISWCSSRNKAPTNLPG